MGLRNFLTLLTVVLVVLLMIVVWLFPSEEDFRVENTLWNGTSNLEQSYAMLPLSSLEDLPAAEPRTTIILIPYLACNAAELEGLSRFVYSGGTLVLADDYGYGNRVLDYLGLEARFSGQPLLDPLLHYKSKYLPKVNLIPDPITGDSNNLVLNHATCLMNVAAPDTLATSSSFSFLDHNDNGIQDDDEPNGPLPVISRHKLGSGQVMLVADPSLFINGMETLEGNEGFRRLIADPAATLYLDQSHLYKSELHQTKDLLANLRASLATPLVTSAVVIILLVIVLKPIWGKKRQEKEEV